jgi:hypothetical protein
MSLRTWNLRSLYTSRSLTTLCRELTRYTLGLVDTQEVRWVKGDTVSPNDYIFSYAKGNVNHQWGTDVLYTTK